MKQKYLLISFILWLIGIPFGLTGISDNLIIIKLIGFILLIASVIYAIQSMRTEKTVIGPILLILLNVLIGYIVLGEIIHPTLTW